MAVRASPIHDIALPLRPRTRKGPFGNLHSLSVCLQSSNHVGAIPGPGARRVIAGRGLLVYSGDIRDARP